MSAVRRFATARQRRALWRAFDGKCAHCGAALSHDFHADHVIPWSARPTTNPHEMQPLCAPCNLKKGNRMLRGHQQEALTYANDPDCGTRFKHVLASVTPGGGKSALPVIFGDRMLKRGLAQKICWVVPRDSLRRQAEHAFLDPYFRGLLGHSREIRAAGNDINPTRGLDGYVTTYQAVACDPDLHADEFARHKYTLIIDEGHHIAKDSEWHRALQPLVDRAALVVVLSGTLSRADGQKIAFIDYEMHPNGRQVPVLENRDHLRVIRYSRKQALSEEAVLPIYFERVDGRARWLDADGEEQTIMSLAGAGAQTSGALYTALRQEYAFDLLEAMLAHWRDYVKFNPRAKFLVVAPNISLAKTYLKRCRDLGFYDVDIATSEDSDDAKLNIERLKGLKRPELQGLVTVAMAYEGLDCPPITHIACLTHIRAHEWIEQMLARATRVDRQAGAYHEQQACVWAPDDDLFSEAIAKICEEQAAMIREREDVDGPDTKQRDDEERGGAEIIPLDAASTAIRAMDMQTGKYTDAARTALLRKLASESGLGHIPVALLEAFGEAYTQHAASGEDAPTAAEAPVLTASEKEAKLRKHLDRRIKQIARGDGETIKALNIAVIKKIGKPREEMNQAELERGVRLVEEYASRAMEAQRAGAR
jgi:superfamily II DNA or RNA helicase